MGRTRRHVGSRGGGADRRRLFQAPRVEVKVKYLFRHSLLSEVEMDSSHSFLEGGRAGRSGHDELKFPYILGIVPAFHQEDKIPESKVRFIFGPRTFFGGVFHLLKDIIPEY